MKKSHIVTLLIFLLVIPATLFFGLRLSGRAYYFTSTLVIAEILVPFLLVFENRKPEARELVVIAVVAAIGVVGRAVFFMVPNMKPVTAIVIIAGACLGPESGFLTGAMTAGFAAGVTLADGQTLAPAEVGPAGPDPCVVRVVLHQGVYHQIKRMFGVFGAGVNGLHREAIGPVALDPALAPGQWRELTGEEVSALRAAAGKG